MSFEVALRSELSEITGLTEKIYPLVAPDNAKSPFVVYESSEGIADKTLGGYLLSKSVEVEINVVANSYSELKQLTKEVVKKIVSFERRIIGASGPFIQEVVYRASNEFYQKETKQRMSALSFEVYFNQGE